MNLADEKHECTRTTPKDPANSSSESDI